MRGEGELAFLSRSAALGTVCWNTLGDSRTEDTAVVVAGTNGKPAIWKVGTSTMLLREAEVVALGPHFDPRLQDSVFRFGAVSMSCA